MVPFWYIFSSISVKFGGAMVCIFAGLNLTKLTMMRPSSPDMPLKCTKKGTILYFHTQIQPKFRRYFSGYSITICVDRKLCRLAFVQTFLVFKTCLWFLICHCFKLLVWFHFQNFRNPILARNPEFWLHFSNK